jgi:hypothetical protein
VAQLNFEIFSDIGLPGDTELTVEFEYLDGWPH